MINITKVIKLYKKIALASIILLVAVNYSYLSFADTIIMKDGGEIRGQIIEDTDEAIKIETKFDTILIKKEDVNLIKKEKITYDLILTKDGVKDQWGFFVPPHPLETGMVFCPTESMEPKFEDARYERYNSLAKKYEHKAGNETIVELKQAGLMTALIYYRIASQSPDEAISKFSRLGIEKCSGQLFNPRKEEIAIPYGPSMSEHIISFMRQLADESKKKIYTDIYFKMGKHYEVKADKNKSSDKQLKNMGIAINCYQIVMTYSPDEQLMLLAQKSYQRCSKKVKKVYIQKYKEQDILRR